MNAFPALTGDVVTEAHAQICEDRGHATHTVDGVDTGICPRCGESKTAGEEQVKIFKQLDRAAQHLADVKWSWKSLTGQAHDGRVMSVKRALDRAREELDMIWNALSTEQLRAYGEWRKAQA